MKIRNLWYNICRNNRRADIICASARRTADKAACKSGRGKRQKVKITQMVTNGENRLQGSLTAAVALEFVLLFLWFFVLLFSQGLRLILQMGTVLEDARWGELLGLLLLLFFLQNPLRLGIIGWYQQAEAQYTHPRKGFAPFLGLSSYFRSVWFCMVRSVAVCLIWFLSLLPAVILAAVLQVGMWKGSAEGGIYAGLIVLFLLLMVLGVLFALFLHMGFFFADYFYVRREEQNPFRALWRSRRLMRGGRLRLLRLWICLLPYFLLCLLIVPIPFAAANIRSALAVYANDRLEEAGRVG